MPAYEGIRVLDFTQFQQGPTGTQVLGDFGAEVIKIERPGRGDGFRGTNPSRSIGGRVGYGGAFVACNRNKKSVALNLKAEEGRRIVHRLVEQSDVVVSNFRPGVMERLGLGYDELSAINPRIICAYGTGYGLSGPDRDTPGQDMMAQCRAGLVRGDPPRTAGFNLADQFGGMMLAQGIMIALAAREKTGRGQVVDTNLLNTALVADTMGAVQYLNFKMDGAKGRPPGTAGDSDSPTQNAADRAAQDRGSQSASDRRKGKNPLYALYQGRDGRWVHVIDAFRDQPLRRMCKALGLPDSVADDPRYADIHDLSVEDSEELGGLLADAVANFTPEEVVERFRGQDMMAVPVHSTAEAFADPQVLHNGMILEMEHPEVGTMKTVGFPIKLSDTPAEVHTPPPLLGEHTREILRDVAGVDESEIDRLCADGVAQTSE